MTSTRGTITSVERAFAIVEVVATAEQSLGVSAIARACRLPKSTVVRLLRTLEELEVVERVAESGRYRVGAGLARLAVGTSVPGQVRDVARPVLRALVDELEEDAGLAVADGGRLLFVDQISCENPVQVPDWSGQRVPYHAAAAGYVLLAGMSPDDVEQILEEGLEPWTPHTVTDEARVRRRVARARRDRLAWVHEEWATGINGIAAPVLDPAGHTIAAINLYGPSYRFPGSRPEDEVERRVVAAADRITQALGRGRSEPSGPEGP